MELLISTAILLLLAALTYQAFQSTNSHKALDTGALKVLTELRNARSLTLSSKHAQPWGVHIASSSVTLFQGGVYDAATTTNVVTALNSFVTISSTILAGGGSDVIFERLTGETAHFGTITLSLIASSTMKRTITVYETGVVEMQ